MQIPFSAYADDCTVSGELALRTDRLSDFLASTTEFEIASPEFRALDDGRTVSAESCEIERDDLCLVLATGPRGRAERRLWTRQHPVRLRVGPYVVIGYLHSPPTIDPFRTTDRRAIVALTSSLVGLPEGDGTTWVEAAAVLVNTSKIDHLETASEEDIGLARSLETPAAADPAAKDMTAAY
ncbi:MAG TPA: hypothetical protein VFP56_06185 [Candidatus Limnocylindrales bacterium]|nr:hypothetical protein [Candidatus Limnocylindrales bacterium]